MGARSNARAIPRNPIGGSGSEEAAVAGSLTPGGTVLPGDVLQTVEDGPSSREESEDLTARSYSLFGVAAVYHDS
ncbi:hypothetical protein PTTG_25116 [Puccinia triticina 1-1 BBBD Race 1]|uniref:Uncharacterized protein n=1 Tax=Puccinia triticina (isolate 1-1 / race 1 (BBBD)) TaxID=630390 RepID=A0A180H546_PUCT1|nr:hypothetical protein PTTG_25116 [Puccinia triticina 1-1 BBBD Race 1]